MNSLKDSLHSLDESINSSGTPSSTFTKRTNPTLEQVGLKDILPQYDNMQPISTQFPHVALTLLKSPRGWAGHSIKNHSCWTLNAMVWSNETTSKSVGPFDWCYPDDIKFNVGLGAAPILPNPYDANYLTGIERTNGPRPPNSIFPGGKAWSEAQKRNSDSGGVLDNHSLILMTPFGAMFANVINEMGANFGAYENDMRVWIVNIPE